MAKAWLGCALSLASACAVEPEAIDSKFLEIGSGRQELSFDWLLGAASIVGNADAKPPATLRWQNGESITGEIVEASAADLTWKSPFFAEPLVLDWSALRRVEQALPSSAPADSFGFVLRDGSYLYGDPLSITDDAVMVHSSRHGDFALKRSELLSMRRVRTAIYFGPHGDFGWKNLAEQRPANGRRLVQPRSADFPLLVAGPGGSLLLPYWNTGAFIEQALPDLVEVEFHVRSSKRPEFQLTLEGGAKQQLRIETWDTEVVLAAGDQFKAIRTLAEGQGRTCGEWMR